MPEMDRNLGLLALEHATGGVFVAAPAPGLPLQYASPAIARLTGRPAAVTLAAALPEAMAALAPALDGVTDTRTTVRAVRPGGEEWAADVALTPVRDAGGALDHWLGAVEDVSTREEALERARATEARYRTLVEHVPLVTYTAAFSLGAPLTYVSPQIEALTGHLPEEFLSDDGLWYRLIHPEDRNRVRMAERRSFEERRNIDVEYRMIARDGTLKWVWERDTMIRDATGEPRYTQGAVVDVTSLRRTEDALREERDRAQSYLDVAGTIITVLDPVAQIVLINRAGHALLGYADGELVGRDFFDTIVPERDHGVTKGWFRDLVSGAREPKGGPTEQAILASDGTERIVAWHTTAMCDENGVVTALLVSGVDITARRAAEEQIAFMAYHDPLTGLPNRALLHEHLELALARARRSGAAVALLYLDLDDFKTVNDSLGHAAGDELLCHIAVRLSERRRETDLLARQGGDEFLLLLSDLDRGAVAVAEQAGAGMLESLARPFRIAGAEFHVGASVGISVFPRDAADADALLRHADAAMYETKAAGRNGVGVFSGRHDASRERLSMSSRLRQAIARDEFVLHFQPIVSLADGSVQRAEALLRWEDPHRGTIAPGEFIPFAEETGLIGPVGDWVIDALCAQRAAWRAEGIDPAVTLNVSPRQLRRPDFAADLCARLAAHGMDPASVTLELTESAAMSDPEQIEPVLRALAAAGLTLAIDDFGAGYSSLSRLRELPVQVLKIDRSFLRDVPTDPGATAMITAIIELAGALGMEIVAEGVEREEQRSYLVANGCRYAQGWLLGRPAPADALAQRLRETPATA